METKKMRSGYSLIEMVIYVAILSIVTLLITNTIVAFLSSYKNIKTLRVIDSSGIDSMERMTRDIRSASTVDDANSTLGSNPGALTIISSSGGVTKTTKYYLQNNTVKVDVNGVYFGPITSTSAVVNNLTFTKIDNTVSVSIKIDMTISSSIGSVSKTKSYHSTIILKGQ